MAASLMFSANLPHAQAADASFPFEIDLPLDDTYELEYTLGSSTSEYLSKVELYIDNVSIGKNDGS